MAGEINFGLIDPGAFARGFENSNRMLQAAADKHAGKLLAAGDRSGAADEYARRGFVKEADATIQSGQVLQNNELKNQGAVLSNQTSQQGLDTTADKEKLDFTMRAATAISDVMKKDGPQAAIPAFDQMLPLLKTRGISDEQIAQLRGAIEQDPERAITGILGSVQQKLQVMSLGAIAVDETGKTVASNPMPPGYQSIAPNSQLMDKGTGEIVARGTDTSKTWKKLTPEEAADYGYAPGVQIQVSNDGEHKLIDQPSASSQGPNGGVKMTPATETQLSKIRDQNNELRKLAGEYEEFMVLNNKYTKTGGVMAAPMVPELVGAFNKDVARMNSITANSVPKMRQGLPGAASDRDTNRFEKATLSVKNSPEANQMTANATKGALARMNEYADFTEQFALRNGTLIGSQAMWNKYIDDPANDFLRESSDGTITLVKPKYTWQQYMRWDESAAGEKGDTAGGNTSDAKPNVRPAGEYVWTPDKGLQPK